MICILTVELKWPLKMLDLKGTNDIFMTREYDLLMRSRLLTIKIIKRCLKIKIK
jgi:hypothetical protein